mgnify:CR=1 FL=1
MNADMTVQIMLTVTIKRLSVRARNVLPIFVPIRCATPVSNSDGLVPVIVQDYKSLEVLMLAYMDGMEAARLMRARGYGGMLIFITVLKEEVFEAFEVRAFDYLVKPLEDSRFKRTMGRTLAALVQEPGNCLVVQKGNLCQAIPFTQIIYCEVLGRKVYILQNDGLVMDYYDIL